MRIRSNRSRVALPSITPIAPVRIRQPFDHAQWVFEPKLDGFRVLAYIQDGICRLVSKRGHAYKVFASVAATLASTLEVRSATLDGEPVCVGPDGQPRFYDLMFRRAHPVFFAFDLLWLDDEDLRELPLPERKRRLRRLVPRRPSRLLYVEHVGRRGCDLFQSFANGTWKVLWASWHMRPTSRCRRRGSRCSIRHTPRRMGATSCSIAAPAIAPDRLTPLSPPRLITADALRLASKPV